MSLPPGPEPQPPGPPVPGPEYGPQHRPAPRGGRKVAIIVLAVTVLAGLLLVVPAAFLLLRSRGDDSLEPPDRSAVGADGTEVDLADVEVYGVDSAEHTEGPVTYDQSPPIGGDHDPAWEDCGVYDEPVREENVVHSLEHGTVWVTYRPGLAQADIDKVADLLPQKSILSPYDHKAPLMVTVWGRQLELEGPDDPRLPLFIDEFKDGHTTPEAFASCAGGVRRLDGEGQDSSA